MDPVTAAGLAAGIVQFIDYTCKIVHSAKEIYDSATGATLQNQSLESVVAEMRTLSSKLTLCQDDLLSDDEKALGRLAADCRVLSVQILELLGRIKPKQLASKRGAVWFALQSIWTEKEKQELTKRLDNCRSQLALQLNVLTRSEIKFEISNSARLIEGADNKLDLLQTSISDLRSGVEVTSFSEEAREQLKELLVVSEGAYNNVLQQRFLDCLAFRGMHQRFEAVHEAHCRTFEWLFREDHGSGIQNPILKIILGYDQECERQATQRQRFLAWLSSENGFFHISGKMGSGKSTLMKFLCNHRRTKMELLEWAGSRKLVFCKFFFWRAGSKEQTSVRGLLRSVLYDILCACPELISHVIPSSWNSPAQSLCSSELKYQISDEDIAIALHRVISLRHVEVRRCFCIFIDGLDEFEETAEDDYRALLELLKCLTLAAPEDVKFCVSSRENNVFLNFFSPQKRLRLHELTKLDMTYYVADKLCRIADPGYMVELIQAVVIKADGVFFWAALVAKSLRERAEEDPANLQALRNKLDTLPAEMDNLFVHLLDSIGKHDRQSLYRLCSMLDCLPTNFKKIPVLTASFMDEYDDDPNFALRDSCPWQDLTSDDIVRRVNIAGKRINRYCKGLLQVEDTESIFFSGLLVSYTHRSVFDFLQARGSEAGFVSGSGSSFLPILAFSRMAVAEIRASLAGMDKNELSYSISTLIDIRRAHQVGDVACLEFLESLAPSDNWYFGSQEHVIRCWRTRDVRAGSNMRDSPVYVTSPLAIGAFLGEREYTISRVRRDCADLVTDGRKLAVLLSWLHNGLGDNRITTHQTALPEVYEILIEEGGLSTNTQLFEVYWGSRERPCSVTLAEYFFTECLRGCLVEKAFDQNAAETLAGLRRVTLAFLHRGICSITFNDCVDEQSLDLLLGTSREVARFDSNWQGWRWPQMKSLLLSGTEDSKISLDDVIDYWNREFWNTDKDVQTAVFEARERLRWRRLWPLQKLLRTGLNILRACMLKLSTPLMALILGLTVAILLAQSWRFPPYLVLATHTISSNE